MPRPANPNAPTATERNRRWRADNELRTVQVHRAIADPHIAAIRKRYGDGSDGAATERALRMVAERAE